MNLTESKTVKFSQALLFEGFTELKKPLLPEEAGLLNFLKSRRYGALKRFSDDLGVSYPAICAWRAGKLPRPWVCRLILLFIEQKQY